MIKYLLFVCLITTPFAQTSEAVVTHYDLEGNLIQEDNSLQVSEDIDSMNSMTMNQQDVYSSNMDSIGTDSMDYKTPEQESIESSNLEAPMNLEQTENDSMNVDPNSMPALDSMTMNDNQDNSMTEQDSMYSTNDPNDINAVEPISVEEALSTENTEVSNLADVNSEVTNEIHSTNLIADPNDINTVDPNNLGMPQDNQIDVQNILGSNVEFTTETNISNNLSQNEVDPNMAFEVLTNTDNLQSTSQIENGFAQSEVTVDKSKVKEIPEPKNDEEDQGEGQGQGQGQGQGEEKSEEESEEHQVQDNTSNLDDGDNNQQNGASTPEIGTGHTAAQGDADPTDQAPDHTADQGEEDGPQQGDVDAGQGDGDVGQGDGDVGQGDGDVGQGDGDAGQGDGDAGQGDSNTTEEGEEGNGDSTGQGDGDSTGQGDGDTTEQDTTEQDTTEQDTTEQADGNQGEEEHNGDKTELKAVDSTTSKQLVQGNCIIIYSQCNFKGESLEACNSLSEIEEFKAQIRSIYIPDGLGLTVYDGENFTGNLHKFKSSQECLTTPLSFAQLANSGNQLRGQSQRSRQ